jgi:hypothetical protein
LKIDETLFRFHLHETDQQKKSGLSTLLIMHVTLSDFRMNTHTRALFISLHIESKSQAQKRYEARRQKSGK